MTQLRREEQQRAEQERVNATQDQLSAETRLRSRRGASGLFGLFSPGAERIRSILGAG